MSYRSVFGFRALLLLTPVMMGACTSNPLYPQAQAYNKEVHGFDKGQRALLVCMSLPPLQIRKDVQLDVKSYVAKEPAEKVQAWYDGKLSDWRKVAPSGEPKPVEDCPNGISYAFPQSCTTGNCTRQVFVLNEAANETWIVLIDLK